MDVETLRRHIERSEHIEADLARVITEIGGEELAFEEYFREYARDIRARVAAHECHPAVRSAVEDALATTQHLLITVRYLLRQQVGALRASSDHGKATVELAHEFLRYVERRQHGPQFPPTPMSSDSPN